MTKKKDVTDYINVGAIVTFLMIITVLLMYIAFFK